MKTYVHGEKIEIYDFNLFQAYKIARHLEEQSIEFYTRMLDLVEDEEAKTVFRFLITEERKHLDLFSRKLHELYQEHEDGFEEDDIVNYVDTEIFKQFLNKKDIDELIENKMTVIDFAKFIEKRSITFYENCLKNSRNPETKQVFKEIIEEEKKHLEKFELAENLIK